MQKGRYEYIDFLRAITILAIIVVHTLQYNLDGSLAYFLWNYLHFDVVAFVFCSGFVLSTRYKYVFTSTSNIYRWTIKRMKRLVFPFYIYLGIHYSLWLVFPGFFTGTGLKQSWLFFIQSITFTGGTDNNWLPLLFVELSLLFPLFIINRKNKIMIVTYTAIALAAIMYITVSPIPASFYRAVMWLPWSLILLLSLRTNPDNTNKKYILITFISVLLFIFLTLIWDPTRMSFRLIDHKYPPDLYFFSYGTAVTSLLLIIGKQKILHTGVLGTFWKFVSTYSYEIYFIHYIVLDFFRTTAKTYYPLDNQFIQCVVVIVLTLLTSRALAWYNRSGHI